MSLSVARKYALALFQNTEDQTDRILRDFEMLKEVLDQDDQLVLFLNHPKLDVMEKKLLFSNLLTKMDVMEPFKALMFILVNKRRFALVRLVMSAFDNLVREQNSIVRGEIESMAREDLDQVKVIFERKLNTKIDWFHQENNTVIAGFRIRIEDTSYDATLSQQLKQMKSKLVHPM